MSLADETGVRRLRQLGKMVVFVGESRWKMRSQGSMVAMKSAIGYGWRRVLPLLG